MQPSLAIPRIAAQIHRLFICRIHYTLCSGIRQFVFDILSDEKNTLYKKQHGCTIYTSKGGVDLLTREAFISQFGTGVHLLDGATGTAFASAGMPMGCCVETWFLNHPHILIDLQHSYAAAGSEIIYAPTFRACPWRWRRTVLQHQQKKLTASLSHYPSKPRQIV